MRKNLSPHVKAVCQALLDTLLWSSSIVLIKIGLKDIPPLPFAGLRYTLAFLCLLPFAIRSRQLSRLRSLPARTWVRLILLGLLFYSVTQGSQFLSLFYLPAAKGSLFLSFTTIVVALLGISMLGEWPSVMQWGGAGLYLLGVLVYLYPLSLPRHEVMGLIAAGVGMLANALSSVLGRYVNRARSLDPVAVTVASMGAGGVVLLLVGVLVQGLPRLTAANWVLVLWLAVVNSALAFTLWNRVLRTLLARSRRWSQASSTTPCCSRSPCWRGCSWASASPAARWPAWCCPRWARWSCRSASGGRHEWAFPRVTRSLLTLLRSVAPARPSARSRSTHGRPPGSPSRRGRAGR